MFLCVVETGGVGRRAGGEGLLVLLPWECEHAMQE